MIRKTFSVPPLGCNCSIIGDPITKQAIVVDPGGAPERILQEVRAMGLTVVSIVHTHAHFDHFLASGAMKQATGAALCLHPDDLPLWDILEMQCRMFGVPYVPAPPPDYWLKDEERLAIGELEGIALHTPGHTPGSMCFHFPAAKLVVAGDTLFRGSIGRTDLWGGDFDVIEQSIRERLYTLDEQTAVVTGHGGPRRRLAGSGRPIPLCEPSRMRKKSTSGVLARHWRQRSRGVDARYSARREPHRLTVRWEQEPVLAGSGWAGTIERFPSSLAAAFAGRPFCASCWRF
jgi:hydroxyacylglutathione hydrolase